MPQNHDPNNSAFEHFFPEERREDDTDPGMTIAAQPAAYVAPPPAEGKSLTAPLIAFSVALLGLAVVGFFVINNLAGHGRTQAVPTSPASTGTSQPPSSAAAPSSSSSSTPSSPSSSSTESSTDSSSASSSSSSPASSSSSPAVLAASLPQSQTACGSPSSYSTTGAVSCAFADSIYSQVRRAALPDGQSTTFAVTSLKSEGGSGLTYNVSCVHQSGSFITCTAVSEPDNGLRPEVFVMPTER